MDVLAPFASRVMARLNWWAIVGFAGQTVFFCRFLLQWLHSERVKRSEIPIGFWFLSMGGGLIMLVYVVHLADAVLIIGQLTGLFVYARNLHLIFRARHPEPGEVRPPAT